jgi:hypothetical protein
MTIKTRTSTPAVIEVARRRVGSQQGRRSGRSRHAVQSPRRLTPSVALAARMPKLVAALTPVWLAVTHREREAVFRSRYDVYATEYGRRDGAPDHRARRIHCPVDDDPATVLLYTTDAAGMLTGSARISTWAPGAVDEAVQEEYGLDALAPNGGIRVCDVAKLMVAPAARGAVTMLSLAVAMFEHATAQGCQAAVITGWPGLVPLYTTLGFRPYPAPAVATPDGVVVPLMMALGDSAALRDCGSSLASLAELHAELVGPPPGSLDAAVIAPGSPLDLERGRVRALVGRARAAAPARSALGAMSAPTVEALADSGFVLRVRAGCVLTAEDVKERELYLLLAGAAELTDRAGRREQLGPGYPIGAEGVLGRSERRLATAAAVTDVELLVVRRSAVRTLAHRDPGGAAELTAALR